MLDVLVNTAAWFDQAKPECSSKDRHTQLGVHFEEVGEMIAELKGMDRLTQSMLTAAMVSIHALALHLKASDNVITIPNPVAFFGEMIDQIVTSVGVGRSMDLPMVAGLEEVNDANYSKFVDGKPVFDANRKIIKGPDFKRADLAQLLVVSGG